jgi:hypothetical protein
MVALISVIRLFLSANVFNKGDLKFPVKNCPTRFKVGGGGGQDH